MSAIAVNLVQHVAFKEGYGVGSKALRLKGTTSQGAHSNDFLNGLMGGLGTYSKNEEARLQFPMTLHIWLRNAEKFTPTFPSYL